MAWHVPNAPPPPKKKKKKKNPPIVAVAVVVVVVLEATIGTMGTVDLPAWILTQHKHLSVAINFRETMAKLARKTCAQDCTFLEPSSIAGSFFLKFIEQCLFSWRRRSLAQNCWGMCDEHSEGGCSRDT